MLSTGDTKKSKNMVLSSRRSHSKKVKCYMYLCANFIMLMLGCKFPEGKDCHFFISARTMPDFQVLSNAC